MGPDTIILGQVQICRPGYDMQLLLLFALSDFEENVTYGINQ